MKLTVIKYHFSFLILLFLAVSLNAQQSDLPKFALVIGNGAYTNLSRLANPINDANDIAKVLESLGFTVQRLQNASLDEMEAAIEQLKFQLNKNKSACGFFYYAGHGVQYNGDNYLT